MKSFLQLSFFLMILLAVLSCLSAKHLQEPSVQKPFSLDDAYKFLVRYGYVDKLLGPVSLKDLTEPLKAVQKLTGIPQTGELDDDTIQLMTSPICGFKDISTASEKYVIAKNWSRNHLTYKIRGYPSKVRDLRNHKLVDREIALAFKYWSEHTNLRFKRVRKGRADIEIDFLGASHEFRNDALAHAFLPESGDVHMNDEYTWNSVREGNEGGHSMLYVMAHELGHSLGIKHSKNLDAVMFENFRPLKNFKLSQDDINAIQALYGRKHPAEPKLNYSKFSRFTHSLSGFAFITTPFTPRFFRSTPRFARTTTRFTPNPYQPTC